MNILIEEYYDIAILVGSYISGYINGGYGQGDAAKDAEVLRFEKGSFSASSCNIPNYPIEARNADSVVFDQSIVVCGGHGGPHQGTCYQLKDNLQDWIPFPEMKQRRSGLSMVAVGDGLYAIGSSDVSKGEFYRDGTWSYIAEMPEKINYGCAVALTSNTIMYIGGSVSGNVSH